MGNNDGFLFVDFGPILEQFEGLSEDLAEKLDLAAKTLAIQADAKIREWATERLHSRRPQFLENLHWEQISKGMYAVVIKKDAVWIEDGVEPHSMLEDLLSSSSADTVKKGPNKGKRYVIVPFKHNKGPTKNSTQQNRLVQSLKKELGKRGISSSQYSKLARNPDGSPKLGLISSFNVDAPGLDQRRKAAKKGLLHRAETPEGNAFLSGVRIYQHAQKDKAGKTMTDAQGNAKAERSIVTFRVALQGSGGWNHPGLKPQHFLEDAEKWIRDTFDKEIVPSILSGLGL